MPRLAPQFNGNGPAVIEHRLTLGTMERQELRTLVRSHSRDKWLENIPQMLGAAAVGAGLYYGLKFGGAAIGAGLDIAKDAADFMQDTYHDLENSAKGLNPDGTAKSISLLKANGDDITLTAPFADTWLGGISHSVLKTTVATQNTFQAPGRWVYRKIDPLDEFNGETVPVGNGVDEHGIPHVPVPPPPPAEAAEAAAWTEGPPPDPLINDTWWNPDQAAVYYWDGHAWMPM